jgi:pantoate--beta-alanine ligase
MIFNKDSLRDYKITKLLPNFKIFCVLTSTFTTFAVGKTHPNMRVFKDINPLKEFVGKHKSEGQKVGLVPTMGALHEGHLTLINSSLSRDDLTICSIYVNPTQFNVASDLKKYPRTEDSDVEMLSEAGCQAVFIPSDDVMYPGPPAMHMDFGDLEQVLEGAHRPGHFRGVGLVVSKLFHIVEPHRAYFGQKDWQQVCVIQRLVQDLNFPLELEIVPTVRNDDGLAMSSRNRRLNAEHRTLAPKLYEALNQAKVSLQNGESIQAVKDRAHQFLNQFDEIRLEYLEIVHSHSLTPPNTNHWDSQPWCICVAAFLGEVRLIDNVQLQ